MKKTYSFFALAFAAVLSAACVEENFEKVEPARDGDEIIFNAVSGVEVDAPKTRTVYSGATYTVNNRVYERIEWTSGDKVKIYCHTANNKQEANYSVTPGASSTTQTHTASLNKHESNDGIQWNGNGLHTFYAIYPSPDMPDAPNSKTTLEGKVNLTYDESTSTATLTGYVPTTQAPIGFEDAKQFSLDGTVKRTATKWAKPDMRYTYMVACNEAKSSDKGVNLSFSAISTVMEIDITASEATTISEVIIQSKSGKALTGNFTCDINSNGTPVTESVKVIDGASTLTIQLGSNVSLQPQETLRVTALLLPTDVPVNDLNIIVQTDNLFRGNLVNVALSAHKKHYLTNLSLPTSRVAEGNDWISMIDPATYLDQLSIPGAGNAFSSAYNGQYTDYYKTQTKSFTDLWNMGVRCFELVTDRPSNSSTSLDSQPLRCNKTSLGNMTFKAALDSISLRLKKSPEEFAMIICTYQSEGNNPSHDGAAYMASLCASYDGRGQKFHTDSTIIYKPSLRVGDARGKMMIIARPTSEGENPDTEDVVNSTSASDKTKTRNILTIKGWGTLPDKWYKRGYNAKLFKGFTLDIGIFEGASTEDNIASHADLPAMEDYIDRTISGSRPQKGNPRFEYKTDQTFSAWVQEWRRVCKEKHTYTFSYWGTRYRDWEESMKEKKSDVKATFDKSINDSLNTYVYINSLCGYYIVDNEESFREYYHGNMGDIGTYADDINDYFYTVVEEYAAGNTTGPMGVILMDRIGASSASIALPKMIYSNNFKFPLKEDPDYAK